jgi:hypothetical protein
VTDGDLLSLDPERRADAIIDEIVLAASKLYGLRGSVSDPKIGEATDTLERLWRMRVAELAVLLVECAQEGLARKGKP